MTIGRRWMVLITFAGTLSVCNAEPDRPKTLAELTTPSTRPEAAPRQSDVCMRLFTKHDGKEIEAGKAFHITFGVWSYINNRDYIQQVRSLGWRFQGTLNGHTTNETHALLKDGKPVSAFFNRYWADPANPAFRQWYLDLAKKWIDNGATSLQRDDPTFGEWQHKMRLDNKLLAEFHAWAKKEIEAYAGHSVTMSINGMQNRPFEKSFDYFMTEVDFESLTPEKCRGFAREMRKKRSCLILTGQRELPVQKFRLAVATAYATGLGIILPWDQFNVLVDRNPKVGRTFVEPAKLADLTGFVRANARFLDGYEEVPETATQSVALAQGSGKLTSFPRAKPGDTESPVVIHLVDGADPKPATVRLHTPVFFGNRPIEVRLLVPVAYDKSLHDTAEQSKDYSRLVTEAAVQTTTEGDFVNVAIPALTPWGILVVQPGH